MDLLEQIGRALQGKYTFQDLHGYFAALQIPVPGEAIGSKRVFAKEALKTAPDDTLLRIADELGLNIHASQAAALVPPRNWKDTTQFRIFISHISKDKDKAIRLKECLEPYGISGFVAHEDIHPVPIRLKQTSATCRVRPPGIKVGIGRRLNPPAMPSSERKALKR